MTSHLGRIEDLEPLARKARYSVSALASFYRISKRKLERDFKFSFRGTPQKWTKGLQIRDASALILEGVQIKVVGGRVWFKHATHFGRAFKKATGRTPLTFLQESRRAKPRN